MLNDEMSSLNKDFYEYIMCIRIFNIMTKYSL